MTLEELKIEIIHQEQWIKGLEYRSKRREIALQKLKHLYEKYHHLYFK